MNTIIRLPFRIVSPCIVSPRIVRSLILACSSLMLTQCVLISGNNGTDFEATVRNSRRVEMDPEVVRSSEALHSYLVGELRYGKEEYRTALKDFARARELLNSPVPAVHARLAELYLQSGDPAKALDEAKSAKSALPDDIEMLLLYAGILDILSRTDEAKVAYEEVIEKEGSLAEPYALLADLLQRAGRGEEATAVLKKFEDEGEEPLTSYYLARAYEKRGDLQRAEKFFLSALKGDPRRLTLALDVIRFLLKNNKIETSIQIVDGILSRDPLNIVMKRIKSILSTPHPMIQEILSQLDVLEIAPTSAVETRYRIALVQLEKQNIGAAVREFSLVVSREPDYGEARYYLGSLLVGGGKKKEGVDELLKIPHQHKTYIKARTLSALVLKQQGKYEEAEQAIRSALKEEPSNRQLFDYLIVILREGKRLVEAEKLLKDAVQKSPEDTKLLFVYGVTVFDLKKREEAERILEEVVRKNPHDSEALNIIAYSLAETDRELDKANSYIQRALEIQPNNAFFLDTLAWVLFKRGDHQAAKDAMEKALEISADDIVLLDHYGDILLKMGDTKKAIAIYTRALNKEHNEKNPEEAETRIKLEEKLKGLTSGSR